MWLRDSLPYAISDENGRNTARVMIYGYESSLPNSDSFQNLEDLGSALHFTLRTLALDGTFKPVVFIAHSLGGLVVKQVRALILHMYCLAIYDTFISHHSSFSYLLANRAMSWTKSYVAQSTESPSLVSRMTAWTFVRLFPWPGTGQIDSYWSPLDPIARRSSALSNVSSRKL